MHLIHIGFAKTGSTFLRRWLSTHPQIAYAEGGIAGFRDLFDVARQGARGSASTLCRATSLEVLTTPHPTVGSGSTDFNTLRKLSLQEPRRQACSLVAELFPSATILIVTRGFGSMILSSYSEYVRSGGDMSFEAFCAPATGYGAEWWDYDEVIGLYERTFGSSRVLVLPYELLRQHADAFFAAITGPLGLEPHAIPSRAENRSISAASLAWYPRFATLLSRLPRDGLVNRAYRRAAFGDRLSAVAAGLQRVRPLRLPGVGDISSDMLRELTSRCELLRHRPLHQPYLDEYFMPRALGPGAEAAA
ncbi:MAG: hypothetical protein QOH81_1500 [Sphingomonadales bacterium]|jgi:hypothetical protein|nr:hypothetical protein [Sphingomonadales bacterium]